MPDPAFPSTDKGQRHAPMKGREGDLGTGMPVPWRNQCPPPRRARVSWDVSVRRNGQTLMLRWSPSCPGVTSSPNVGEAMVRTGCKMDERLLLKTNLREAEVILTSISHATM